MKQILGRKDRMVGGVLYVLLAMVTAYTLFPIYFLAVNAFKSQAEIVKSPIGLPKTLDFSYIIRAFEEINLFQGLGYTILVTAVSVLLLVLVSSLAAWVMVRSKSRLSSVLFMVFTAAMLIPFQSVMYPLLKSTTVTVIILNTIWIWNDYLLPFMVIGNTRQKTLTLELYYAKNLASQYGNPWELIIPAVLVSSIPIIILYIFLQKQFIGGVADGAVKG